MSGSNRTLRSVLTILTSVLLIAGFAGTAGAATDVTLDAAATGASYTDSTNMGKAVFEVEVANLTGGTETVQTTVSASFPKGVSATGVTTTATDANGTELSTVAGEPDGPTFRIDTRDMPQDQVVTYEVTIGFTYDDPPTALLCSADGGLAVAVTAGEEASATACVDAPAPAEPAAAEQKKTEAPGPADADTESAASDSPAPESPASDDPASDSPASDESAAPAPKPESSDSAAEESAAEDSAAEESAAEPDAQSSAAESGAAADQQTQLAPQQQAAAAAAPSGDPVGDFGSWANEGIIYFSGWAYDPSDMSKAPTTMWTLNGNVVAYQAAQHASPDLYPYGVFNRGVFGGLKAPSAGTHSICMFVFNIGEGSNQLVRCHSVQVANGNPVGDVWALVRGDGSILVNGYAYDPSNTAAQTPIWITDNGKIVAQSYANATNISLTAYGVWGAHGIDYAFSPSSAGAHQICLYVHNIGWGTGQWARCVTVQIDVNPWRDNPKGDFAVTGNSQWVSVSGWAYDPNQPFLHATTMWTVDGNVAAYSSANQPHSGVNKYLGIPGNHGVSTNVPASQGWHTVCMFVANIGLGESVVTRCTNVQVLAPPNPCPAYAKACIDLTNNTTWLQSNGQITAGPFKQIAGRAGYRTPTGTYRVFWKHIDHVSSIYNAPMPYSIFFNGGIAFHVGSLSVPSHGCIHLSLSVAQLYWNNLSVGDYVYVFGAAQY